MKSKRMEKFKKALEYHHGFDGTTKIMNCLSEDFIKAFNCSFDKMEVRTEKNLRMTKKFVLKTFMQRFEKAVKLALSSVDFGADIKPLCEYEIESKVIREP